MYFTYTHVYPSLKTQTPYPKYLSQILHEEVTKKSTSWFDILKTYHMSRYNVLPLYHIPGLLLKVQTTEKTWNPKTGKEIGDISKNQEPSKVGYISLSTISDSKLTGKNCSTLNSKSSTGKIMLRKLHTWFINMH